MAITPLLGVGLGVGKLSVHEDIRDILSTEKVSFKLSFEGHFFR